MIEVQGLTRKFGNVTAVDHFNFQVNENEVVALLGLNGAGKTTTLRMLTGYLSPTEGSIFIEGFSSENEPLEVKRRIGYLPERPALYNEMTVSDFLRYMYRIRLYTRDNEDAAVASAMQKTGIEDKAHSLIGTLSAGYKKRVGLSQALVHSPRILILDEPITDLDPLQIVEIRELILGLKKEHTILLSSHILSEVQHVADRYLFLREGRLVAEETRESLHARVSRAHHYIMRVRAAEGLSSNFQTTLRDLSPEMRIEKENDSEVTVFLQSERDIRSDITRAVFENGYDLLSLEEQSHDLEELFLELASGSKKPLAEAV